jgi:DNA-binding NarL/FixJ family response regulator
MRQRLRVIIADDQPLLRAGFKALLESAGDIEIVGEAGTGEEAIEQARRYRPDVVLMDIRMPGMDEYIIQALRAGASGFILKDTRVEDLLHAVRTVAAGEAFLSPAVTRQLLDQVARRLPAAVDRGPAQLAELTERELAVLRMLGAGLSNSEIATALFLSEATVKTHVSKVLQKLTLRDRVQAAIFAYESGLIEPGTPPS